MKMKTASANDTLWVYLYPLRLNFKEEEFLEFFVTFDEPNLFVEPYDTLWIKMVATVIYLIGLWGAFIQYSCIIYEVKDMLLALELQLTNWFQLHILW